MGISDKFHHHWPLSDGCQHCTLEHSFDPFTPRVSYGDIKVILTSESVDEILWCDHSNETSSAVLSHGTIYIYFLYKMKFVLNFDFKHSWE